MLQTVSLVGLLLIAFIPHQADQYKGKLPKTQKELVESLRYNGHIKSASVAKVMSLVDRKLFVKHLPYEDIPKRLPYGNKMVHAPNMHAFALEMLKDYLSNGKAVLDVSSASGYLTTCMALMVGPDGYAVGLESIKQLVKTAERNVKKFDSKLLNDSRILFVEGDGMIGFPDLAPYDVIHVGSSVAEVPKKLLRQLKNGGRMLIPLRSKHDKFANKMVVFDKDKKGNVTRTVKSEIFFVPYLRKHSKGLYIKRKIALKEFPKITKDMITSKKRRTTTSRSSTTSTARTTTTRRKLLKAFIMRVPNGGYDHNNYNNY